MGTNRTPMQKTGDAGECAALDFLLKKGYKEVARNYHSRYGEVDLIVKNDEYIVFAEVKTRRADAICSPSVFVDKRKQQKLIKTAVKYLSDNPSELQPRFDVLEVTYDSIGSVFIEHIENAFWQEGYSAF